MKAPAFDYVKAGSVAEALALLAEHGEGAKLLAGGQSLVPALNLRLLAPEILIDLNGIDELSGVVVESGRLRLGALTRHAEIERSEIVRQHAPLLTDAVRYVAHPAIRARGTLGGNLAHADPASEFPACMIALGAEIVVAGPTGERRIAAEAFFTGVYETALSADEILVAVELPGVMAGLVPAIPMDRPPSAPDRDHRDKPGDDRGGQRHVFLELARRLGDYALVGVAATATVSAGEFADLRPVFFAAGPHPVIARHAASHLVGQPVTAETLDAACAALSDDLDPEGDLQIGATTRLHLARTLLRRAVVALVPEAGLPPTRAIAA